MVYSHSNCYCHRCCLLLLFLVSFLCVKIKCMQAMAMSNSHTEKPIGTGGFLEPEIIVDKFGIEEGMKIADFGCGAGYFTVLIAERTGPDGKVYALDIQESSLDSVRAKARALGLGNIETIRTNLEILGSSSLSNSSQDSVMIHNVLFQSSKKKEILSEAWRVLKPQGKLIAIEWAKGAGGFGPPDELRLSAGEIETIAKEVGFVLEKKLNTGQFHFGLIFNKK